MPPSARRYPALALACLSVSGAAWSADWAVAPTARLQGEFNTNRRLQLTQDEDIFGMLAEAGAKLTRETGESLVSVYPRGQFIRYTGKQDLDSENAYVDLLGSRKFERWTLQLGANYTRDSTILTEIDSTGANEVNRPVDTYSVSPSIAYMLTARDTIRTSFYHTEVAYQTSGISGYTDYTYRSADLSWARQFSETDQVSATVYYTDFEASAIGSDTNSVGLRALYNHMFSPTLSGSAGGGVLWSSANFLDQGLPADSSDVGFVVDASAEKKFEVGSIKATFSRNVFPSSRGAQQVRNDVSVTLERRFRHRLDGQVGGRYLNNSTQISSQQAQAQDLNRNYYQAFARLGYQWTREWRVTASYTYSGQKYDTQDSTATGNMVAIAIQFTGDKIFLPNEYLR